MALFEKITENIVVLPSLTALEAQSIYNEFKLGNDFTTQFINNNTPLEYSIEVWDEIKRLEREIIHYVVNDTDLHSEDELMSLLSSELLDIPTIVSDCILYNPTYQEGMTFTEFVNAYRNQEENII